MLWFQNDGFNVTNDLGNIFDFGWVYFHTFVLVESGSLILICTQWASDHVFWTVKEEMIWNFVLIGVFVRAEMAFSTLKFMFIKSCIILFLLTVDASDSRF